MRQSEQVVPRDTSKGRQAQIKNARAWDSAAVSAAGLWAPSVALRGAIRQAYAKSLLTRSLTQPRTCMG